MVQLNQQLSQKINQNSKNSNEIRLDLQDEVVIWDIWWHGAYWFLNLVMKPWRLKMGNMECVWVDDEAIDFIDHSET